MMPTLPTDAAEMFDWSWEQYAPFGQELLARAVDKANQSQWLADWTRLTDLINEVGARLYVANTLDTADKVVEARYFRYVDDVTPGWQALAFALTEKYLALPDRPVALAIPERALQAQVDTFAAANLPLDATETKLKSEYNRIIGAQTIALDGAELTLVQVAGRLQTPDRALRERLWRAAAARRLQDRAELNDLWRDLLALRRQQAANAGFPDYRAYRWRQLKRFDYTPADCETFRQAILEVVVPAANRIYDEAKAEMGVTQLRPWDVSGDFSLISLPPLRPYEAAAELVAKGGAILNRVDPELGEHFATMRQAALLDLENRKGKAPGGYCTTFAAVGLPFIFMNAVGVGGDVRTLLHEAGHAFHVFAARHWPYFFQRRTTSEFNEVASMAMELLATPYLARPDGGFFAPQDALRFRIDHLRKIILFWPYMAVVDGFQHWAFTQPDAAADPAACDAAWDRLWTQFIPAIDWTGLDAARATGWHRKQHIYRNPFYYVEYGLAQMGALQVWANALTDPAGALRAYRQALSLGGTRAIPDLYTAAGARFAFDSATMASLVDLIETNIAALTAELAA